MFGDMVEASAELDALQLVVADATAENANGHPARAARLLRPALTRIEDLPDPSSAARLHARAAFELAKSEFELRGDAPGQLARLDELVATFDDGTWPGLEPAVAGLRGLLLLRAGRVEESVRELDTAVRRIDRAEPIDAACALLNRGVLHLERGDLARARRDLTECIRVADRAGFALVAFKAAHNLGYLEFLAGRLPLALQRMAEASRTDPGGPRGIALLDRARVLVEAGLIGPADATLADAIAIFAADRLPHDLAEAELARAECALLRGDLGPARELAAAARRRFLRRGDEAWAVRATLLGLQVDAADLATHAGTRRAWSALRHRAVLLEERCRATGRPVWAYAASLVALEAALALGKVPDARARLAALGPVSSGDPIAVRLHGRRVRAELALAAGDRARAVRHVREGQRDLATHRASFGSLELRTAGAVHGTRLAEMDVAMALSHGGAPGVLDAAERTRDVLGGFQRVNPPRDPDAADLLAELRQLLDSARGVESRPVADPERIRTRREALRLKQAILARSWHRTGNGADGRSATHAQVHAALRGRPGTTVLDVLEHRGRLLAVRVTARGSTLLDLGDAAPVREQTRRTLADLEVVANPMVPGPLRVAAERSLGHGLGRLGRTLDAAVRTDDQLVVVVSGWLGLVPWSMLPGRAGRATVVAPSARHWLTHSGSATGAPARVSAAAGPGLRHAQEEVEEVGRLWPGSTILVGAQATCAEAIDMLGAPGIVHLAAHGRHEPDNPLFSSVRMSDGPLFAHELDPATGAPELVILSSCEVGRASVRPGGEALGLASVLLRGGVGCVVAAVAPLADETALRVMTRTHESLSAGTPVAAAIAEAARAIQDDTGSPVPLVCFGAPV